MVVLFLTVISTGSARYFLEIRRIWAGMVAENSATCLSSGVSARIVSTSSAKPILSISSASSRTRKRSSREVERALLEVVHDPAGRADDDVDAATQGGELDAVPLAAVDRQDVHALHVRGVLLEGLGDLERELAGRRQDEGLRGLLREVELRQDRQREGGRLAGAGLGEADDVTPLEQRRDGLRLDRRGRLVAHVRQRLQHCGGEAEVGEGLLLVVGRGGGSIVNHPSTVVAQRNGGGIRRRGDVRHVAPGTRRRPIFARRGAPPRLHHEWHDEHTRTPCPTPPRPSRPVSPPVR